MQFHARRGMMLIEAVLALLVIAAATASAVLALRSAARTSRVREGEERCSASSGVTWVYCGFDSWFVLDEEPGIVALLISPEYGGSRLSMLRKRLKTWRLGEPDALIDPWTIPYVIEFPEEGVVLGSFVDTESDEGHFEGDGCAEGAHASLALRAPVNDVGPSGNQR